VEPPDMSLLVGLLIEVGHPVPAAAIGGIQLKLAKLAEETQLFLESEKVDEEEDEAVEDEEADPVLTLIPLLPNSEWACTWRELLSESLDIAVEVCATVLPDPNEPAPVEAPLLSPSPSPSPPPSPSPGDEQAKEEEEEPHFEMLKETNKYLEQRLATAVKKEADLIEIERAMKEMGVLKHYLLELAVRRKRELVSDGERAMHAIYLSGEAPCRISQATVLPAEDLMNRTVEFYLKIVEDALAKLIKQLKELGWEPPAEEGDEDAEDAPSEEGADAEEALPLEAPAVGEAPAVEIDREAIAVLMPQKEMLDAEIEALKELLPEEQEEEAAEAEDGQEPLAIGGPSTKEDPVPLAIAN